MGRLGLLFLLREHAVAAEELNNLNTEGIVWMLEYYRPQVCESEIEKS